MGEGARPSRRLGDHQAAPPALPREADSPTQQALFLLEFSSLTIVLALNMMTYFLKPAEHVSQCSVTLEVTNFLPRSFLVRLRAR